MKTALCKREGRAMAVAKPLNWRPLPGAAGTSEKDIVWCVNRGTEVRKDVLARHRASAACQAAQMP